MNSAKGSEGRILVLEPEEQLASAIVRALGEAAPSATVDCASSLEEAQRIVLGTKPDLFVLDVDATYDLGQEFLYDLRTSHPNARAIILTAVHLAAARERAAGLGAIHFLEKPFPHSDFVDLVQALLRPAGKPESEKFQGTLSDLHVADIIQLKCMNGTTAAIEFTGPKGEKGRVFFENGQVVHATAPGKEGLDAFSEIAAWKGGTISEIEADSSPRTINVGWQHLLMEAMQKMDEAGAAKPRARRPRSKTRRTRRVLVIDDSPMLLSFVKEILREANYDAATAPNGAQGLSSARKNAPDLILLDYVLPDMKGDEVVSELAKHSATARTPIVCMSGFGSDLQMDPVTHPNVIGSLNKPFTSDLLIRTVENHMPKSPDEPQPEADAESAAAAGAEPTPPGFSQEETPPAEPPTEQLAEQPAAKQEQEWWSASQGGPTFPESAPFSPMGVGERTGTADFMPADSGAATATESDSPNESVTGGSYFCGDTEFFSLNSALQTIAKSKLTGTLRCFWHKEPVELLTRNGQIVLATTRDPELYCSEAPITLVNVDAEKVNQAKARQRETGQPIFITLAQAGDILQEPAAQLVQHYGQKLFSQLWPSSRVRFAFERNAALPSWANDIPSEGDVDLWALATLRLVQFPDVGNKASYDPGSIPAYTRDGFDRIQNLRLTVAEAQFASQFNGVRSFQQIAKNLRLDLKFARLTLFRFLALEIVECWSPTVGAKPEKKGLFQRLGIGQ